MDFDKSKILTVVTADQAKVGQKGWFADDLKWLNNQVEHDEPAGQVAFINPDYSKYRFQPIGGDVCALFYPAPEPTYAERQAQWVKENNVKVGTKVRVTRTFTEDEDGSYCFAHDDLVGKTGIIRNIFPLSFGVNINDVNFKAVPYFALEVIKEQTYRKFANAEEFKPYRDKWCIDNLKGRFKIDWHSDTHIYEYGNSFITWEEAFSKYKFEDGTPFGVEVEEDANN